MKIVVDSARLLVRLGVTATALLLSQQALALGTDAGTTVSNQATVAYDVATEAQTPIESDPAGNSTPGAGNPTDFLVDRRVSFTLIETSGGPTTPVAPGDDDVITSFTLTNTGNAIMDFRLTALDFAGPVFLNPDTTDLGNYRVRVANGDGAGGVPDLAIDLAWVDELAEDAVVEIYVFADAPLTVLDGQYANIELTAYAADEVLALPTPGVLDPDLVEDPGADDPTEIESVFGDAGNDGLEAAQDSYEIVSAALTITKIATVISDPFGSGKALPGAIVEYTITVDNTTGSVDATSVSITDLIDSDVTFQFAVYDVGVTDSDISFNAGASFCYADVGDVDLDGCSLDGAGNLVVGNANLAITVAAGASLTIQFQVLIPNT